MSHHEHISIEKLSDKAEVRRRRRYDTKGVLDEIQLPIEFFEVHEGVDERYQMTVTIEYLTFIYFNGLTGIYCETEHVSSYVIKLMDHLIDVALHLLRLLFSGQSWLKVSHLQDLHAIWETEISYDFYSFIID